MGWRIGNGERGERCKFNPAIRPGKHLQWHTQTWSDKTMGAQPGAAINYSRCKINWKWRDAGRGLVTANPYHPPSFSCLQHVMHGTTRVRPFHLEIGHTDHPPIDIVTYGIILSLFLRFLLAYVPDADVWTWITFSSLLLGIDLCSLNPF